MEVLNTDENVSHAVIGGKEAQGFGIAATSEFVQMMSSSLYSNQKKAVVRETICNAWDAHIASGKTDVPIKLTLNEEWFIIEDNGYGIPHEKMNEIYCVYGASTKKKDSSQTGGFGLGCKSPFAYTDNFNVENKHGGIKTKNLMTRSSGEVGGMPGMTEIMKVEVPSEDTGIKVSIPMQETDIHEFHKLIIEVVFYGGIKATLGGVLLDTIDYDSATNDFVIAPKPQSSRDRIFVKYGNVIYPIPAHDEINHKTNSISNFIGNLDYRLGKNYCFIALAEPNSINISPSREQITLHGRTLTTLNNILDNFQEYSNHSETKVNNILSSSMFNITKDEFKKIDRSTIIGQVVSSLVKSKDIMYKPNDLPWLLACSDRSNIFRSDNYLKIYLQAYRKFVGKPIYLKLWEKYKNRCSLDNFISDIWRRDILKLFLKNGFKYTYLYAQGRSIGSQYYNSFSRKTCSLHIRNLYGDNTDFVELVLNPSIVITHAKNTILDRLDNLSDDWYNNGSAKLYWIVPKGKESIALQNAQIDRLKKLGWRVLDMRQAHPEEPAKEVKPKKVSTINVDDGLYTFKSVYGRFASTLGTEDDNFSVKSKTAKHVILCNRADSNTGGITPKDNFEYRDLLQCFGDDLVIAFTKREMNMYTKQSGASELTEILKRDTVKYLQDETSVVHKLISMDPRLKAKASTRANLVSLLKLDSIWNQLGMTKPTVSDLALVRIVTGFQSVPHSHKGMYDLMVRNIDPHPKLVLLESLLESNPLATLVDFSAIYEAIATKNDDDPVKIQAQELLEHIFGDMS